MSGPIDALIANRSFSLVVVGGSAGSIEVLTGLFSLPRGNFTAALAVVVHLPPGKPSLLPEVLGRYTALKVVEPDAGEPIQAGTIYTAPPNYHLLVNSDQTFALSVDEAVQYSRPSIDVLFESAAAAYGSRTLGILLTGASEDGAQGLRTIAKSGGLTVVQSPESAASSTMPQSAIELFKPDLVLSPSEIKVLLSRINELFALQTRAR